MHSDTSVQSTTNIFDGDLYVEDTDHHLVRYLFIKKVILGFCNKEEFLFILGVVL